MLKRVLSGFIVVVLVTVGLISSATAQENNWLPPPTGPYQVGTAFFHWIDETRDEVFTDDLDDRRELMVQLWYPAQVESDAVPVTYLPHGEVEAAELEYYTRGFHAISGSFEELGRTPTHSYLDAPISGARANYPVVIHSVWGPAGATVHLEELASHGYVVASIYHPYVSVTMVFPDGRVVRHDPHQDQDQVNEVGAQDMRFVLDQLERLNDAAPDQPFSGRLNLDRVGAFSAMMAGEVSTLACLNDDRFAAVVILGGRAFIPPMVWQEGVDSAVMLFEFGNSDESDFSTLRAPVYRLHFTGYAMGNLLDVAVWPGVTDVFGDILGDVDGLRSVRVVSAYVLAFFDQYLKGEESRLLERESPDFPEVKLEIANPEATLRTHSS